MSTITKGKYRHYKGHLYEVTGTARHCETLEDMVVYKALYGDFGIWVRPLKMFLEDIELNGKIQKRFEFVENESSKEIHIDALKSDYKLFEATSDEVDILEEKLDKFNLEQLSFVGDMEIKKNYLIKNKTGDIVAGIRGCFYNDIKCIVVGRVSMDMIAIDLRNNPSAKVGDKVTLWGDNLPIEEVANHTSDITWRLLTGISGRVRYVWV